jgi:hypothetical protein
MNGAILPLPHTLSLIKHDIISFINVKISESNAFQCCCSFDNVYRIRENGGFIILNIETINQRLKSHGEFQPGSHTSTQKTGREFIYASAFMKIVVVLN